MHSHSATAPLCHCCGEPTLRSRLTHADDLRVEVIALLQIGQRTGLACTGCVDSAERELDSAEEATALDGAEEDADAKLAKDPFFQTVCDAHRDGAIECMEAETSAQWAALTRCGGDALDLAVSL